MALATLADVKRVLGIPTADTSQDVDLQATLDAVDEYIRRKLRRTYSVTATTQVFYFVREDQVLVLDEEPTTISSVKDNDGNDLDYRHVGGNRIRLDENDSNLDPRFFTPGADVTRFDTVTVTFVNNTTVPKPVRDAVAMITAEMGPAVVKRDANGAIIGDVIQEKIGDYGYMKTSSSMKGGVQTSIKNGKPWGRIDKAMWLLRPYFKRRVGVVP